MANVGGGGEGWDALMPALLPANGPMNGFGTNSDTPMIAPGMTRGHGDLVRAVVMNDDVVVSGSYDATIKVCLPSMRCCSLGTFFFFCWFAGSFVL